MSIAMESAEFEVGDTVTFNAYNEPIKARVCEVKEPGEAWWQDPRWKYRLEGISKGLVSVTSGLSIEESRHFKPYDGNWAD